MARSTRAYGTCIWHLQFDTGVLGSRDIHMPIYGDMQHGHTQCSLIHASLTHAVLTDASLIPALLNLAFLTHASHSLAHTDSPGPSRAADAIAFNTILRRSRVDRNTKVTAKLSHGNPTGMPNKRVRRTNIYIPINSHFMYFGIAVISNYALK